VRYSSGQPPSTIGIMATIEKLNKRKSPMVKIDKSLEKLRGKNLFPEKLAKANETISRVGLPKK